MHMCTDLMKYIFTMKVPLPLVVQITRYSGNNKPLKIGSVSLLNACKCPRTNYATKLDQSTLKVMIYCVYCNILSSTIAINLP